MSKTESPTGVPVQRTVRLSGRKLIEYRRHLHREMEMATGQMQDAADRLGDPKYPTALSDLEKQAIRFRDAGLNHARTLGKTSIEVRQPNESSSPATVGGKDQ